MHADAPSPRRPTSPTGHMSKARATEGYDTRHEHAELLLLGAALLTIVAVVLVSISTLIG